MPRRNALHARLTAVSGRLSESSRAERDRLVELEALLVRARIEEPEAMIPRTLSIERTELFAAPVLHAERDKRVLRLVVSVGSESIPLIPVPEVCCVGGS